MTHKTDTTTRLLAKALGLQRQGLSRQAMPLYAQVLQHDPNRFEALFQLGMAQLQSGQAEQAAGLLQRAVAVRPQEPLVHFYLAASHMALAQFEPAVAALGQAIALRPAFADALVNRGIAQVQLNNKAAALADFAQALQVEPDHVVAWCNRGGVLRELGLGDEALAAFAQALQRDPRNAMAHYNAGLVLLDFCRIEEAKSHFTQAAQLEPQSGPAQWNLAVCHLLLGEFGPGWQLHEWRWRNPLLETSRNRPQFRQPLWLGDSPLAGKTLFVHGEQGLGDSLQFCRYAPLLAAMGARVILGVQKPLVALLQSLPGVQAVIGNGDALPAFDLHCPMMSLPLALWSSHPQIPASTSYLQADPVRVRHWAERLPTGKPRIGLVWSGRAAHANDLRRSMALALLTELLREDCCFVSLQKEIRPDDAEQLRQWPDVLALGSDLTDFADTAALCANLDLVISVDTSIAHLAAALGRPTWVLLPFAPDWRWQLARSDSPWYPSVRLFRQTRAGDWASVVQSVRLSLAQEFASPSVREG